MNDTGDQASCRRSVTGERFASDSIEKGNYYFQASSSGRKNGLADGVSANFTTSAFKNCFIVSYLPAQLVRGSCSCTGFCTDSTRPPIPQRQLLARQVRELEKELLNRIGLRVNIAHGRLNAIVTGYVL
jgi:hypothetical protein